MTTAEIITNKGTMKVELFDQDAPKTVANFVKLANEGFYKGLKWHRVLPGFVIQGGCPNTREGASGIPGTGGPGYAIECELTGNNQFHDKGVLSMAHRGLNTGGSQFFVCLSRIPYILIANGLVIKIRPVYFFRVKLVYGHSAHRTE
ncbi:MAG: peptidylprolyl isomerase [Bacteroidetes bacterium]|nr:peptidylprolyl isomerase [Bacteroidota bacterium]